MQKERDTQIKDSLAAGQILAQEKWSNTNVIKGARVWVCLISQELATCRNDRTWRIAGIWTPQELNEYVTKEVLATDNMSTRAAIRVFNTEDYITLLVDRNVGD